MPTASDDLLGAAPNFLPKLLPQETLYSWCSRYHRLSGNRLAGDTSLQLFGARTAGFWHDFPSRLAVLSAKTSGDLPDPRELALRHTLLGFYAPHRSQALMEEAVLAMSGESVRSLKFRLGLPASQVGADHPLKACPACMAQDKAQYGHAIWRVEHQWPATWVCRSHGGLLVTCEARSKTRNHLQWVLPDTVAPQDWKTAGERTEVGKAFLLKLAQITVDLTDQSTSLDKIGLRQTCLGRLQQRNWLLESGRANLGSIRAAFLLEAVGVSDLPGLGFIEAVNKADGGFLGQMLRKDRARKHPVKTLMLIAFLFESAEDFLHSYQHQPPGTDDGLQYPNLAEDPRRKELANLLRQEALTVSAAARRLAIPPDKAMYWARKDNLPYQRRPRLLDQAKASLLERALLDGLDTHTASSRTGLPLATVRRYLDTHDEVRLAWNTARREQKRNHYREQFIQVLASNPGASLSQLQSRLGSAFSWLRRHDQQWLASRLPMLGT